ncbi:MAG: OmpH family outer membrane protein [Leptospiraceae bacterium]|nr:OmpH family outer membrane protein [Leptospiraceae bacterium]
MIKKYYFTLLVSLSFFSGVHSLFSATLLLKNGEVKKGKAVIKLDSIVMTFPDGSVTVYPKRIALKLLTRDDLSDSEIQKIRKDEEANLKKELEKKNQQIAIMNAELQVLKLKIEAQDSTAQADLVKKLAELEKVRKEIQEGNYKEAIPSRYSSVWRSAVIPGWGHLYLGNARGNTFDKITGFSYGVLFLVSIGYNASLYSNAQSKKDAYLSASNTSLFFNSFLTQAGNQNAFTYSTIYSQAQNDAYSEAVDKANQAPIFIAGIYAIQLIHSFILGGIAKKQEKELDSSPNPTSWDFKTRPEKNPISGQQAQFYELGYNIQF